MRLAISAPFVVGALISVDGPGWARGLTLIVFLYLVFLQILMNANSRRLVRHGRTVAGLTLAWWAAPSVWLWSGIEIVTGSWIAASIVAPLVGYLGMTEWQRATRAGRKINP